jgi:Protein of unknown function (DUF3099)
VATVPDRPGTEPVYTITGVRRSHLAETRSRTIRYLISMGIRTACFLTAIVVHGPLRWVLVAAAVTLPYFAVVFANAGRERAGPPPEAVVPLSDLPALEGPATHPDAYGR